MTRTFRCSEGAYGMMRARLLRIMLPTFMVIVALVFFFNRSKLDTGDAWFVLGIPLAMMLLILALSITRTLARYRAYFRSFELEVDEREITQRREGREPVTLHAYDISSIEEDKSGAFVIRGREPRAVIIAPAQIEDRMELKAMLNELQPVTIGVVPTAFEKGRALRGLLRLASVVTAVSVENEAVFSIAAPLALLLLGWNLYDLQRSPRSAQRNSRMLMDVLLLLFVLFLFFTRYYPFL